MELLFSLFVGTLAGCGCWLLLRARSFEVILGLTLLSYAVNLFILAMGRLRHGAAPIVSKDRVSSLATLADPLPPAPVRSAIVISFALAAAVLASAQRAPAQVASDHVDGDAGRERG